MARLHCLPIVGLVTFAHGIAAPDEPARRALTGTVTGILAQRCDVYGR